MANTQSIHSRLAEFQARAGRCPPSYLDARAAHTIPDTIENADLALDAQALYRLLTSRSPGN